MEGLRGVPLEAWDGFGSLVDMEAYGRPGARARVAYGGIWMQEVERIFFLNHNFV